MSKISVIMSVYNTRNYDILKKSIESILNQTFKDFEFIICDDGSTDDTYKYLLEFARKDKRIVLFKQNHKSLAPALNQCIKKSKSEYIARMDADDIALPTRLEKQITYLKENKDVSIVSTNYTVIDELDNEKYDVKNNEYIYKSVFLYNNPICHPTIMFKKKDIVKLNYYDESKNCERVEDYDLLLRAVTSGVIIRNIEETLLLYRLSKYNLNKRKFKTRINEYKIRRKYLSKLECNKIITFLSIIKPILIGLIPLPIYKAIKLKKINLEKISFYYLLFVLVNILICSILISNLKLEHIQYEYYLLYLCIPAFILIIHKTIKKEFNIYTIIFILLSIFALIANKYAVVKSISLVGTPSRGEGLIAILCYYVFFMFSLYINNKKHKEIIMHIFLFMVIVNNIFGLIQINSIGYTYDCAKGIVGNGGFSSVYNLMGISLIFGLLFKKNKLFIKLLYIFLLIFFIIGLTISTALASFVGLIAVLVILLIKVLSSKNKVRNFISYVLITIIITCTVVITSKLANNSVINDFKNMFFEVNNVTSNGETKDEYGNGRLFIWKNSFELAKMNLNNGIGFDNMIFAFDGLLISPLNEVVDKAHNEYLQVLLNTGIYSFSVYMFFVIFVGIKNLLRLKKLDYIDLSLYLLFIGYMVQALFYFSITRIAPIMFMFTGLLCNENDFNKKWIYLAIKRLFDIIISSFLIVLLSPVLLIIAILIKLDSKGKIFFVQKRVGKNGKEFNIIKFRTMYHNSEDLFNNFSKKEKEEFYKNFKIRNDPRITGFGSVIRDNFADELPQLFNVLLGNMSLVGPRPILKEELYKYGEYKNNILCVKPGITGLWACRNTNSISYKERVALENSYVDNLSLKQDIKILYLTYKRVL